MYLVHLVIRCPRAKHPHKWVGNSTEKLNSFEMNLSMEKLLIKLIVLSYDYKKSA